MSRATSRALTGSGPHGTVRTEPVAEDGRWGARRMSEGGVDITQRDFPAELMRHRPALHRTALRLCRNQIDADDLVQATLERAWRARDQVLPEGNLGGWLFRILSNRHRDNLRRRTDILVPLPDEVPDETPEHEEISALLCIPAETVLEALSRLPPELRAPLELHAVGGKRYREIAQELAVPINTIGTRIRRARRKLHEYFAAATDAPARSEP